MLCYLLLLLLLLLLMLLLLQQILIRNLTVQYYWDASNFHSFKRTEFEWNLNVTCFMRETLCWLLCVRCVRSLSAGAANCQCSVNVSIWVYFEIVSVSFDLLPFHLMYVSTRAIWVKLYVRCASWHSVVLLIKRVKKHIFICYRKTTHFFSCYCSFFFFFYLNMTYACANSEFFREQR